MKEQLKLMGLDDSQIHGVMALITQKMITRHRFNQVNERRKNAELRVVFLKERIQELEREAERYSMLKQELHILENAVKVRKEQSEREQQKLMLNLMNQCIQDEMLKQKIKTCMYEEDK
ncbi:hypothetical protein GSF08_09750 [Clostridiaceae bacterium DONG20-135]|uniref:Uncharacterized protein n=1 Tax=Copranaerobaculum intestinale TaxID=2692629 RepID=A0A6N8UCJ2_9FIRM|nr:hypothetical protein [Copranaerobaculum intestinale]MXQ74219.1 hypothetical protein [Copranaerobaculum intestinale]